MTKGLSERLRTMASVFAMDPRNKQVIVEAADALDAKDRALEEARRTIHSEAQIIDKTGEWSGKVVATLASINAALTAVKKEQTDGE